MTDSSWQPMATLETLRSRAKLLQTLRAFFCDRQVLEVDVPSLARIASTDPHIDSIVARVCDEPMYLQTSPEFFLKRMLAAGSGDIYSLAKAFRNGEAGRKHNPEFTMLEWYRVDWDEHQLMDEVISLLRACMSVSSVEKLSYRQLFQRHFNIDPHQSDAKNLRDIANQYGEFDWQDDDRDVWLDLLMTHVIEPKMGNGLVLVYDFPETQAALARRENDSQGQLIARRFEAYVGGVELANGYWELCDGEEQADRFDQDLKKRAEMGLPQLPCDHNLVQALNSGMPECAGVALGVDRLLMLATGVTDIRQLLAFPFERV